MNVFTRFPRPPPFEPLPLLTDFLYSPLRFLLRQVYRIILLLRGPPYTPPPSTKPLKIVCISDTHSKTTEVPSGDLLIHAGDLANNGTLSEITAQFNWLASLPHTHKIVICGNHDGYFDPRSRPTVDKTSSDLLDLTHYAQHSSLHYLEHSSITLTFSSSHSSSSRQIKIYGAPQIPACGGSDFAFQYPRGSDAWSDTIPHDIDILVTHTPPKWHHDLSHGQGCEHLLREIWRVRPRLHVFGHVHAGAGMGTCWWDECQRAYERIMSRGERGILGDVFNVESMIDGIRMLISGVTGIVWTRIWGGESEATILVNASLTVGSTGKLGNPPTVVYL